MPVVKEFSDVSGRPTNSGSSAARADSSTKAPGNSKAARAINDFQRRFKILISSRCLCSAEWLMEVQPGKQEVQVQPAYSNCVVPLRPQESGFAGRAVAHGEVRGFNPLLTDGEGLHSSSNESGRQERSLNGIGRFAGQEHSLGLGHQAGGISHVRSRWQIKQRGERGRFTLEARGKVAVVD